MISCPRCQNIIDETKRTACPVCLAPLTPTGTPQRAGTTAPTSPYGAGTTPAMPPIPTPSYTPSGSHYVTPPLTGAPPAMPPPSAPGYAPSAQTRTTLTGEVVPASTPSTPPPPSYTTGGYTSPGSAAYGSTPYNATPYSGNQPRAVSYDQPTPTTKSSSGWWNWRIAGGGAVGGAYILIRLGLILLRFLSPHHGVYSGSDYSGYQPSSPYPAYSGSSYSGPTSTQPQLYTPPTQPTIYHPSIPAPPTYHPHFQPPTMPSFPGRGSFGGPASSPLGNR